jgi:DNA repair exonuclease SbcCD ATPase subunit
VKGVDFYVQKSSGDKILAADLSGGQACRWIWAFIATINQMFAKDLGILGLDEPTEGLSDEGKEALKETLPHLAELLAAQRVQLFMATHEKSFSTAFGRLVNVAELRGRLTPELVEKIANL